MEVSPRKLIWAGGMVVALQLAVRSSQLTGVRVVSPTTGGRRLGRADAVIAQEGQGDPESFAQFWVASRPGGMQHNRQRYVVALVARVISCGSKGGANVRVGW